LDRLADFREVFAHVVLARAGIRDTRLRDAAADLIYVCAGVQRLPRAWLDGLRPCSGAIAQTALGTA
jgi:protein-L-isoaspartate O-methyltransferase